MKVASTEGAKLCKDCKHYSPIVASLKAGGIVRPAACDHPSNVNLVHGGPHKSPEELRYSSYSGSCQERGLWWEPTGSPPATSSEE